MPSPGTWYFQPPKWEKLIWWLKASQSILWHIKGEQLRTLFDLNARLDVRYSGKLPAQPTKTNSFHFFWCINALMVLFRKNL